MTAVEQVERLVDPLVQRSHDVPVQIVAGPGGAEPFALQCQEGDLVERVEPPANRG